MRINEQFNINELFYEMELIVYRHIYLNLENNISLMDKAKFWSLKNRYEQEIEVALKNSQKEIKELINKKVNQFIDNIYKIQEDLNETIESVNKKLSSFENLNIPLIEKLTIIDKEGDKLIIKDLSYKKEFETPDYITEIIWTVVAAEWGMILLGPLGLVIGAILGRLLSKDKESTNEKVTKEVTYELMRSLEEHLKPKLQENITKIKSLSFEVFSAPVNIETRLREILKSLDSPEEKEKEIEKNKNKLSLIENYMLGIKNL